jgi:site-specific recombinase XerC
MRFAARLAEAGIAPSVVSRGDSYDTGHDLPHEAASRLLADGVDIRVIQLMLGHASLQQTQRYLNVTDDELRKGQVRVSTRHKFQRASPSLGPTRWVDRRIGFAVWVSAVLHLRA